MKKLLVLMVVCLIISACHSGKDTIKIGAIYNLTGSQSSLDIPAANGAKLAVMHINKQGGVNGRLLELIMLDGKSDIQAVSAATETLINKHKVRLILGLTNSDMVSAALPIARKAMIPIISSGTITSQLFAESAEYLWSTGFSDSTQAGDLADYAYNYESLRTCAILTDTSMSSSTFLAKYFRNTYNKNGGWVFREEPFTSEEADIRAISERMKSGRIQPAMIFLAANPAVSAEMVSGLRKAGITAPIYGGDALDTRLMLEMTEADSSQIICTAYAPDTDDSINTLAMEFKQNYKAVYGDSSVISLAGVNYDTVKFIASALRKVKDKNPQSLLIALSRTNLDKGVAGAISFNADTRLSSRAIYLTNLSDGRKRTLMTFSHAPVAKP